MDLIYQCPVCKLKLDRLDKSLICAQKHTYDISREGYVNLLLANQKNSKSPGDNKLMAVGRMDFLEKGYYDFLSEKICKLILRSLSEGGNILDLGCGVGFYAGELIDFLKREDRQGQFKLWGMDISKPAILIACKRYNEANFSIGSSFHLPYLDNSLDCVISIFAPFDMKEVNRVLKPAGKLIVVRPGPNHLNELAKLIYEKSELQGNPIESLKDNILEIVENYQIESKINLENNSDLMNLVTMTPYYWHLNDANKALLSKENHFSTTANFQITLFQKNSAILSPLSI